MCESSVGGDVKVLEARGRVGRVSGNRLEIIYVVVMFI